MKKILAIALMTTLLLAIAATAMAATGLGSVTSVKVTPAGEAAGNVSVNTTMCAVTLDDAGKIVAVQFDVVQPKGAFDATGAAADFNAGPQTKKELKEGYGMLKASAIGKEWYQQAEALEAWCVGKTVEEVCAMKTFDRGDGSHTMVPDEADLKASVTVTVGDYLVALQKAAAVAK